MAKASTGVLLLCLSLFSLGGCVDAPYRTSGQVVIQDDQDMINITFSDHDRAVIREYYDHTIITKFKNVPPGLAKKGKIPPGHQKQLARQAQLPQGLPYQHLPGDLERRLSPLPEGYLRVMIDGSFVLFNANSRVIFDVIHES